MNLLSLKVWITTRYPRSVDWTQPSIPGIPARLTRTLRSANATLAYGMSTHVQKFLRRTLAPLVLAVLTGCAHRHADGGDSSRIRTTLLEHPPTWVFGPASAVFASSGDFTAHVTWRPGADESGRTRTISGLLAVSKGRVFFASGRSQTRSSSPSDAAFVWDSSTGMGFAVSEALPGYAMITNGIHHPLLAFEPRPGASHETLAGHDCEVVLCRITTAGVTGEPMETWRATDWAGFPIQLRLAGAEPGLLTLEEIHRGSPPQTWFETPENYTRYENSDAMAGELLIRQFGGRGRTGDSRDDNPDAPRGRGRHGGRY